MPDEPARGSRRARAAETETALKQAAKRVFARKGYLHTKITDITAEAGRAAGSFYNHFDSKEALLEALLRDMSAAGDERVADPGSGHNPDYSDPAAIRWHIEGFWRFYREHAVEIVALRQAIEAGGEAAERLRALTRAEDEDTLGHLDYVTRAGLSLPGDRLAVHTMLTSLIEQFAYKVLIGGALGDREISDDEIVDTLTRFVHRGLTGRDEW